MPLDYKLKIIAYSRQFHRVLYGLLLFVTILAYVSNTTSGSNFVIYYSLSFIGFFIFDEMLFKEQKDDGSFKGWYITFSVRDFVYVTVISAGNLLCHYDNLYVTVLTCFFIIILAEDIIFGNPFNSQESFFKATILSLIYLIGLFISEGFKISSALVVLYMALIVLILVSVYLIRYFYESSVRYFNAKYNDELFKNEDIIKDNEKLNDLREKVEKVNSEINYQKIQLTKANDNLEMMNKENNSLLEVMKTFFSSRSIPDNAAVMLRNVINIKEAEYCVLFLDEDVYMNEDPLIRIMFRENNINAPLYNSIKREEIIKVFNIIKSGDFSEPLVLCENNDYKYDLIKVSGIVNQVAFPVYENDNLYGVMIVASKHYNFFENGYAFYETSVVDFTSALISTRLYILTEDMAKKDGLTGIYNRIYFNEFYKILLRRVFEEDGSIAVAMLDIDHFKNINDTYGHLVGDAVIKYVADIDRRFAKKYGGTAVRFGGEEFLFILTDVDHDEMCEIMKEFHHEIVTGVIEYEDKLIKIDASIGLSAYPYLRTDINEVLERADMAMYYSKEHGRGLVVTDTEDGEFKVLTEDEDDEIASEELESEEHESFESDAIVPEKPVSVENGFEEIVESESDVEEFEDFEFVVSE